jgi:ribosome-associated toxin RatA of RatAB toxin-antitoxin module
MSFTALTPRAPMGGGRLFKAAAAAALVVFQSVHGLAEQVPSSLTVSEERGVYAVSAQFVAAQPAALVLNVLTDYEGIPRFLPDIRTSVVRERASGRAVVEQEATSGLMMFSKRVHLVLEIQEEPSALLFRDRCGRSFVRYEGAWRLSERAGQTNITYELTVQPLFDVPGWMLKRLVRRDSAQMIERLQREIAIRAALLTHRDSK